MTAIRSIVTDPRNGFLSILRLDGTISRQNRADVTGFVTEWKSVSTEDLSTRAVHIVINHRGYLVVLTADGKIYIEQPAEPGQFRRHNTWKELSSPTQE
jgi:hypothetical protein